MLGRAALLKREIEAKLAERIPAALSPTAQQAPRLYPVGHARLDALLGGGLPLGSVCELTGAPGSGRSTMALSVLASASAEGACAWVDVSDSFSSHSAAAAGVELGNLLWVRFAPPSQTATPTISPATAPVSAQPGKRDEAAQQNGGSPHPRGETRGVAPALAQMLFSTEERSRRKAEGTPGCPNQPLGLASASEDQVAWERFNARKADAADPLRLKDREAAASARERAGAQIATPPVRPREAKPWDRLGRALRATDQVLQSGGFRVVVLDLASIAPEQALRIPSATWFRFRRAAQESDAILLLLTPQPCARSSAACVIECSAATTPLMTAGLLTTATYKAEVARQRTGPTIGKKAPGRATDWSAAPAWMRAAGR